MRRLVLKVSFMAVVTVAVIMTGMLTTASAVPKCTRGKVVATGVVPTLATTADLSVYMVQIYCNKDTEYVGTKQFILGADVGEGGYATSLTAMSLDREVYVEMEGYAWNSLMTRISIQPL